MATLSFNELIELRLHSSTSKHLHPLKKKFSTNHFFNKCFTNDSEIFTKDWCNFRGKDGSRTAAIPKMEHFVIIVNGWKPLTITTKCSILDVVVVLDPPLRGVFSTPINILGGGLRNYCLQNSPSWMFVGVLDTSRNLLISLMILLAIGW